MVHRPRMGRLARHTGRRRSRRHTLLVTYRQVRAYTHLAQGARNTVGGAAHMD